MPHVRRQSSINVSISIVNHYFKITLLNSLRLLKFVKVKYIQAFRGRWRGAEQGGHLPTRPHPPKFSVNVPFFSKSPLRVSFLKEVTKNVLENRYFTQVY